MLPALQDGAVRHDLGQVLLNMETRYAVEAADRLHEFRRPALVAWSKADRVFPSIHAEALTRDLADARLEWIEDSGAFSPEDQPEHLARLIADFVGTTGRAPVGGA